MKKAFTLIELIITIAILAVLALILVPTVSGYISNSNESVAKTNIKLIQRVLLHNAATYTGNFVNEKDISIPSNSYPYEQAFCEKVVSEIGSKGNYIIRFRKSPSESLEETFTNGTGFTIYYDNKGLTSTSECFSSDSCYYFYQGKFYKAK